MSTAASPTPIGTTVSQPWDALTGNGWNYLRRTSSKDATIVADPTAPISPHGVLRIIFTPDMRRDTEPGVNWIPLTPRPHEIAVRWVMKLSRNWSTSPAGGGKIAFLFAPDGEGQVYINIGGSQTPHRINVNTQWAPYLGRIWEPNGVATPVTYGRWHEIEWYLRWESSRGAGDGVIRWSVDGVVNGEYRNVVFPACCFQHFEFAPTLQLPPPEDQYMDIDHTWISVK
ncbi:MAG TPA: hypothetical protein VJ691_14930 [Vicinamibacterales bacterium]|nr:hypothetical protein [Vicinamibacterales bacterium]